jgi:acetyl esterase/lipase
MANTPPNTPSSFQSQVYAGPQVLSTPTSKPDFSNPRFAWLYSAMRDGTWLRDILKGQDVRSVDPVEGFGTAFPPTVFVGGERDFHVPIRFLERACEELRGLGVECVFIRADGQGHLFEWKLKVESEVFGSYVLPALEFLRDQCF